MDILNNFFFLFFFLQFLFDQIEGPVHIVCCKDIRRNLNNDLIFQHFLCLFEQIADLRCQHDHITALRSLKQLCIGNSRELIFKTQCFRGTVELIRKERRGETGCTA